MEATFRLAARRGGRAIRETRLAPAPASPSRVTSSHFRQSATGRREHRAERMDSRQKEAEGKGEFPPLAMRRTARREESFRRRVGKRSRSDEPQTRRRSCCGSCCKFCCGSTADPFADPTASPAANPFANPGASPAAGPSRTLPRFPPRTGRALAPTGSRTKCFT